MREHLTISSISASGDASILARVSDLSVAELRNRLDELTIRDAARLGRRLRTLRGRADPEKLQRLAEQFAAAETQVKNYAIDVDGDVREAVARLRDSE